jgi:16S rRNA (cytosine967-C5)-methyltransferase
MAAVVAVQRVLASDARLKDVLEAEASEYALDSRDRALARQIASGCVRRLLTLDAIVAAFSQTALQKLDRGVLTVLRVGVYQLVFCDAIPAHAAINESVELTRAVGHSGATGFVNGVLRAVQRGFHRVGTSDRDRRRSIQVSPDVWAVFKRNVLCDPDREQSRHMSEQMSLPEWLVRRWIQRYGWAGAWGLCAASNEEAPVFLRPISQRNDCAGLLERLKLEGIGAVVSPSGRTVRLAPGTDTRAVRALMEGYCLAQDDSAAAVAPFLGAVKGSRVLDLCAAPGGKTAQMAEAVGESADVVAVDDSADRLALLRDNLNRVGLRNVRVVCADGRRLPDLGGPFDFVLVDAPCSNTGVLRRRLEARWRLTESSLPDLATLQLQLVVSASGMLRQGGRMVYSTCALEPEENGGLVAAFLREHGRFALEDERQMLPETGSGDGAYMARIVRKQ